MATRYYLNTEDAQRINECLDNADMSDNKSIALNTLIEQVKDIVFGTPIPDDIADDLEDHLNNPPDIGMEHS